MRKAYLRALRELFTEGLAASHPAFEPVRRHEPWVGVPGEQAYRRVVMPGLVHWLVVVPHHQAEVFFVDVGWSRLDRFPQLTMRPSFVRPADAGPEDEVLVRLGELAGGHDLGWSIEAPPMSGTQADMLAYLVAQTTPLTPDEARARAAPRVDEALRAWRAFGLPFLERHAGGG